MQPDIDTILLMRLQNIRKRVAHKENQGNAYYYRRDQYDNMPGESSPDPVICRYDKEDGIEKNNR